MNIMDGLPPALPPRKPGSKTRFWLKGLALVGVIILAGLAGMAIAGRDKAACLDAVTIHEEMQAAVADVRTAGDPEAVSPAGAEAAFDRAGVHVDNIAEAVRADPKLYGLMSVTADNLHAAAAEMGQGSSAAVAVVAPGAAQQEIDDLNQAAAAFESSSVPHC